MTQTRLLVTVIFISLSIAATAQAGSVEIIGKVCVIDGDSVIVGGERDAEGWCRGPIEARLDGIDAPEWDQACTRTDGSSWPCGGAAKQSLIEMAQDRATVCAATARGYYGRPLATCSVPGSGNLAEQLVRVGLALATSSRYRNIQNEDKTAKRGIWSGTFVKPSTWRKQKRNR